MPRIAECPTPSRPVLSLRMDFNSRSCSRGHDTPDGVQISSPGVCWQGGGGASSTPEGLQQGPRASPDTAKDRERAREVSHIEPHGGQSRPHERRTQDRNRGHRAGGKSGASAPRVNSHKSNSTTPPPRAPPLFYTFSTPLSGSQTAAPTHRPHTLCKEIGVHLPSQAFGTQLLLSGELLIPPSVRSF